MACEKRAREWGRRRAPRLWEGLPKIKKKQIRSVLDDDLDGNRDIEAAFGIAELLPKRRPCESVDDIGSNVVIIGFVFGANGFDVHVGTEGVFDLVGVDVDQIVVKRDWGVGGFSVGGLLLSCRRGCGVGTHGSLV